MDRGETVGPPGGGPAPQPDLRVGDYAVVRELGRGGMGVVYAARHLTLGRPVAIKLLLNDAGVQSVQRFRVEAEALARIRHPNVVAIHEVGEDRGRPFLVMDYVEGESLQDRIKRGGGLDQAEAAALVETLARAIAHVHEQGLLHRDLKPANVLLGVDRRPRITDFGLARSLGDERERLTRTGQTLGTPAYMPPEQVDGVAVDERADVYGLGATLYAALAGVPPFAGATGINILTAVMTRPPVPPSTHRPELDRSLEAVCLRCLAKAPDERYASTSALADDLARWSAGEPLEVRPQGSARAVGAGVLALVAVLGLVAVFRARSPAPPDPKTAASPTPSATTSQAPEPLDEGARRWSEIAKLEPTTKREQAERWLKTFGVRHRTAPEVLGYVHLHRPAHVFHSVDSDACFLSPTRAVVSAQRMELYSLDGLRPRKLRTLSAGRHLTPLGPQTFLFSRADPGGGLRLYRSDKPDDELSALSAYPVLAVSPNRKKVAKAEWNHLRKQTWVGISDLAENRRVGGHTTAGQVMQIAWGASDRLLLLLNDRLEVLRSSVGATMRKIATVGLKGARGALAVDLEAGRVVVGHGVSLQRYELNRLASRKPQGFVAADLGSNRSHAEPVEAVKITGGRVYSISQLELRVWDLESLKLLHVVKRTDMGMTRISVAGRRVLLSGAFGTELWDLSAVRDR